LRKQISVMMIQLSKNIKVPYHGAVQTQFFKEKVRKKKKPLLVMVNQL
jgi:hypothetical protein